MRPAYARIDLTALQHNVALLQRRAGSASVMAVVKADAYGHSVDLIAPSLMAAGCSHFAVTDSSEGIALRRIIGNGATISLLSGIFDADDAAAATAFALSPAVTEPWHLDLLHRAGFAGRVWLKINTGMQRFGTGDLFALYRHAEQLSIAAAGLMSHLACADEPDHPLNREQLRRFLACRELLPQIPATLLNSAGIASLPQACFDFVRPGLALYGSEPIAAQPFGLQPVMSLRARAIQIRHIAAGTPVSYAASYVSTRPMRLALLPLGYADGLPRHLSNLGYGLFAGQRLPIVGRICMDYCLLDVSDTQLCEGDEVEFWGAHLPASEVADLAGTIAYELFTGVGKRIPRLCADEAQP